MAYTRSYWSNENCSTMFNYSEEVTKNRVGNCCYRESSLQHSLRNDKDHPFGFCCPWCPVDIQFLLRRALTCGSASLAMASNLLAVVSNLLAIHVRFFSE